MIVESKLEPSGLMVMALMTDVLDRTNAASLKEEVERVANLTPTPTAVEVDCSRLDFIDTSGVGALLHAHNRLAASCGPIRLTGVSKNVITSLELMQMHRIFAIEATK